MEHHETKDIMHAKRSLGYKHLQSTEFYAHLERQHFAKTTDELSAGLPIRLKRTASQYRQA